MSIELGYWKLRGLAGFIKMLLEYSGAEYKEILYDHYLKEDGSWDRTEWTSVKDSADFQRKFDFPNLPYMTDGNVHLTQSTAILKYLARKFKVGTDLNEEETLRVDLAYEEIKDMRGMCATFWYGGDMAEKEKFCRDQLKPALAKFDNFVGKRDFVSGGKISYVDFIFWEILDIVELFDEAVFEGLENLKGFKARFAALPRIAQFLASDRFLKSPCNGKRAKWGGDKELSRPWEK